MRWHDTRLAYPHQWLVVEVLESHSNAGRLIPDRLAVIEQCPDGATAFERYRQLHRGFPQRFVCFVHTGRGEFQMPERRWAGIRTIIAA